jgi:hypothetical protein
MIEKSKEFDEGMLRKTATLHCAKLHFAIRSTLTVGLGTVILPFIRLTVAVKFYTQLNTIPW